MTNGEGCYGIKQNKEGVRNCISIGSAIWMCVLWCKWDCSAGIKITLVLLFFSVFVAVVMQLMLCWFCPEYFSYLTSHCFWNPAPQVMNLDVLFLDCLYLRFDDRRYSGKVLTIFLSTYVSLMVETLKARVFIYPDFCILLVRLWQENWRWDSILGKGVALFWN